MHLLRRPCVAGVYLAALWAVRPSNVEARVWTSVSGATIEGTFVRLGVDNVVRLSANGDFRDIPLSQFSAADQQLIRNLVQSPPPGALGGGNPAPVRTANNFSAAAVPPDQLQSDPDQPHPPLDAKAAASVRAALQNRRTIDLFSEEATTKVDFYRDLPADGGVLIGFDVTVGRSSNGGVVSEKDMVRGFTPIFLTGQGKVKGQRQGYASPGKTVHVEAKPGYAVAGIQMCRHWSIEAMQITSRLTAGGLDPRDTYQSPVLGVASTGVVPPAGNGAVIVGIHGTGRRSGYVYSLGVTTVPR